MRRIKSLAATSMVLALSTSHAGVCQQIDRIAAGIAAAPGTALTLGGGLKAAGIIALPHSSGAMIAAASTGTYLPGTLGVIGSSVAFLTNPITLTAAGVTIIATGGVMLACRFTDG